MKLSRFKWPKIVLTNPDFTWAAGDNGTNKQARDFEILVSGVITPISKFRKSQRLHCKV